jgi:hypothetical protein
MLELTRTLTTTSQVGGGGEGGGGGGLRYARAHSILDYVHDLDEQEEEDLLVFNFTVEGPRAPAVKPLLRLPRRLRLPRLLLPFLSAKQSHWLHSLHYFPSTTHCLLTVSVGTRRVPLASMAERPADAQSLRIDALLEVRL